MPMTDEPGTMTPRQRALIEELLPEWHSAYESSDVPEPIFAIDWDECSMRGASLLIGGMKATIRELTSC